VNWINADAPTTIVSGDAVVGNAVISPRPSQALAASHRFGVAAGVKIPPPRSSVMFAAILRWLRDDTE
jgi:hypothetical protein